MINIREVKKFDENIFKEFYNDWMTTMDTREPESPETLAVSVYDRIILDNIILDYKEKNINALDIGCANGKLLFNLMNHDLISSGIGIDVSNKMIECANEGARRFSFPLSFINTSLESYMTDERFDIVVAQEVVEHFLDLELMIEKIHWLMKPKSFFYGNVPLDHTCDGLPHLNFFNMKGLFDLLNKWFGRITIILVDVYEGVPNPPIAYEYHLCFRCQKEGLDGENIYAVTSL